MTPAPKVLVVDDDISMVELLVDCLKREGYDVSFAEDGLKGYAAVEAAKPDLVILDLLMPGMHGFDVCEKIKKEPGLAGVKILISSGKGYAVDVKAAKRLGADDYIVKPYDMNALLEKVKALVEKT